MKYPRTIRTYCNRCRQHTEFGVSIYKKGRDRNLAEGNRRYKRKQKGYGGQVKPRQRKTAKTTKKLRKRFIRGLLCWYFLYFSLNSSKHGAEWSAS